MRKSHLVDDYQDASGNWRKSLQVGETCCKTVSGSRWNRMNSRCTFGGSYQKEKPSYIGCTVSESFKDFNIFTEWHINSVGYRLKGYHLDKDILELGNKIYCPELCILIPQALNSFTVDRAADRGIFRQGVHKSKSRCIFVANISISGKRVFLGHFKTEDESYAAYKTAKEAEAYRWYERLKAGEFIVDERVIERMRTWTLEEDA